MFQMYRCKSSSSPLFYRTLALTKSTQIQPVCLIGQHVNLELITEKHRDGLRIASEDKRIWTHHGFKAYGPLFNPWFDTALKQSVNGKHIVFVVRDRKSNEIIGSTRLYDISLKHNTLSVGYTWYVVSSWKTKVNPECKYLLLQFSFEKLQMNRVEIITDVKNLHSRGALRKLGAVEEGILRNHMILENGVVRDSAIHSIVQSGWENVKARLLERIYDPISYEASPERHSELVEPIVNSTQVGAVAKN